jgi:hypothetical protein
MKKQIQGDVVILAGKIPSGAVHKKGNVLAEGEATGHAHRVEGEAELMEMGERLFLRILGGDCRVVHEEHATQPLPPGDYEIKRVREIDPFTEEARTVLD